jgi:hypothetical protein
MKNWAIPDDTDFEVRYEDIQSVRESVHTFLKFLLRKQTELGEHSFHHMKQPLRKFFPLPFFISLDFGLSSLCSSHNVHPVFKCPETAACTVMCARRNKHVTVPLSCCENRTLLVIFSIKMFKMRALILGHAAHISHSDR